MPEGRKRVMPVPDEVKGSVAGITRSIFLSGMEPHFATLPSGIELVE
jgi:hypothetical protein